MVESAHLLFAKIVLNCHSAVTVYLSMTSMRRLINIGYVLGYLFLIKNQQLVSKLYYLQVFLCVCFVCTFAPDFFFFLLLRLFYVCIYFCVRLLNFIPMCKKSPAEKISRCKSTAQMVNQKKKNSREKVMERMGE